MVEARVTGGADGGGQERRGEKVLRNVRNQKKTIKKLPAAMGSTKNRNAGLDSRGMYSMRKQANEVHEFISSICFGFERDMLEYARRNTIKNIHHSHSRANVQHTRGASFRGRVVAARDRFDELEIVVAHVPPELVGQRRAGADGDGERYNIRNE